jgi:predicted chitinase
MEGQGIVGHITFHNSNRNMTRVATWYHDNWGIKAWQDEGKDMEAGNYR